jgi:hypothetical protein
MTDGHGFGVSTDLVWKDNPGVLHEEIYQKIHDFLGVHTYHVMPYPMNGFVRHVDCFAKYLSPDKILVLEVPPSHPRYTHVEDAVDYLENQISCYGTPYEVVRVYTPSGEPYTNSLILNHKVLVPVTGSSWDDEALASYEAAMPGYEVLGFTGSWWTEDALHCRTMGITDKAMLYIHHIPLLDRPPTAQGFPIEAEIIAYSGQAFTGGTPEVLWKTNGNWNSVAMTHVAGDDYLAFIPIQTVGSDVQYYIHAEDGSGRSENHPYIGALDAHRFKVTHFGSDISALSANSGGVVDFCLNAGTANGDRDYFVLGSLSGTEPGTQLPGGLTLPLNWDLFTHLTYSFANTPLFADFSGKLDNDGVGTAQFNTQGPMPREIEGAIFNFAFILYKPFDFVSEAVAIQVVD